MSKIRIDEKAEKIRSRLRLDLVGFSDFKVSVTIVPFLAKSDGVILRRKVEMCTMRCAKKRRSGARHQSSGMTSHCRRGGELSRK